MKAICLIFCLLLFSTAIAQETSPTAETEPTTKSVEMTGDMTGESGLYILNEEEFKFIPEEEGFRITKLENGTEKDYGTLRQTAEEGYFVLTSKVDNYVSYGRFDESGNFRALRYDEQEDKVLEENFMISSVAHGKD